MGSLGTGRDVHSMMLSVEHFLRQPRRRPPLKGRTVLELVNWCFEPSQPPGIISGLKETLMKRDIVEKAIRQR